MDTLNKIKAMLGNSKSEQQQLSAQISNSVNSKTSEELQKMLEEMKSSFWDPASVGIAGQHTFTGIGTTLKPSPPLTPEEERELQNLDAQRNLDIKKQKLDYFKKLPREFRQQIVNHFMWEDAVKEMDELTVPQSERHNELQIKKSLAGSPFLGGFHHTGSFGRLQYDSFMGIKASPSLPAGITKEDLLQAHLDASLEEEISEG